MRSSSLGHARILKNVLSASLFSLITFSTSLAIPETLRPTRSDSGFARPAKQSAPQEVKPSDVRELKLGEKIERELAGGQGHSYRVMMTAGQYMHVVVEQKGIDVAVRLFGPDGKQLFDVDSPNGTRGPEPVFIVADIAAVYRLDVEALDKKALSGRYEINVKELRESTAPDLDRMAEQKARLAGQKTLAEAEELRSQGTAESLRKAVEKYNETASLWRTAQYRAGEALALNQIGTIYWRLGESHTALEYYGQALPLWRTERDRREEGNTLTNIGTAHWQLGDSRKALEHFRQALPLWRAVGDRLGEAITLNAIGVAYLNLAKLQEALDYQNQSLALQRAIGNREEEATTLGAIGSTYIALGEPHKALEYFDQALSLHRASKNRRGEAITLNSIGVTYLQLGDKQKALDAHNQALPIRRAIGDRNGEFYTLGNVGRVHQLLGETQKALGYYNQALALARATGDRWGEAATLHNLGSVWTLSEPQKALDFFNQTLLMRQVLGDRRGQAITLSAMGDTHIALGKPDEALKYLEEALSLNRVVGDRGNEAAILQGVARAERGLGRLNEARAHAETALGIIETTRSKLLSQDLRTTFSASRQEDYEFYIDLLMQMHRAQPSSGHDAAALQASERARARSLLDILTESRAEIRQGVEPTLLERERSTQQQLSVKSERLTRLLGGKHTEEQEVAARKEVDALLTDYQEVQTQIRSKSPRYAALTQPQPLSLKEIQQMLDGDTLLLEYALGKERSYLWAVTPTSIGSYELPKRIEIEVAARRVYDALTARNKFIRFEETDERNFRIAQADAEYWKAAMILSRMLLGPVGGQMTGKRLLIVGDGILQYLPFAALPTPLSSVPITRRSSIVPLIAKHEVISVPSASTLAVLRKEIVGRALAPRMVAVLADPVFDASDERVNSVKPARGVDRLAASERSKDNELMIESKLTRSIRGLESDEEEALFPLPRLPFTRREAEAVVSLAPPVQSEKSLDFAANRAAAINPGLSRYRYVHFATHAILNTNHPELSGIVLSLVDQHGNTQDGFLLAHEIYNLDFPAELVVLSGCRTGLGKEVRGEGLLGLTRGFMYSGAASVLVSLWEVNDSSSAELMAALYSGMLGKRHLTPSAALRQAQLRMWQSPRWRAPYYWAPFVLHGEYR